MWYFCCSFNVTSVLTQSISTKLKDSYVCIILIDPSKKINHNRLSIFHSFYSWKSAYFIFSIVTVILREPILPISPIAPATEKLNRSADDRVSYEMSLDRTYQYSSSDDSLNQSFSFVPSVRNSGDKNQILFCTFSWYNMIHYCHIHVVRPFMRTNRTNLHIHPVTCTWLCQSGEGGRLSNFYNPPYARLCIQQNALSWILSLGFHII